MAAAGGVTVVGEGLAAEGLVKADFTNLDSTIRDLVVVAAAAVRNLGKFPHNIRQAPKIFKHRLSFILFIIVLKMTFLGWLSSQ